MTRAEQEVQRAEPGKALARRSDARGPDAWADLRPAFRWISRRRPVLLAAIVMIVALVAWRAAFLGDMYFYRQDFFDLDFAVRSPLSWHYLTYVGTGHLMIGERAIIWVLARISLYNWGLAAAVSLAFLAGAGFAAFAVLRTLFGERPAILLPLAIYLLTPLGVAGLGWLTVALESVPLQLALFMALNSHIHYVRTRRTRHLAAAAAWVAFGLLVFEKGLIVPVLLFAVTSAFLVGRGSWLAGVRRAATQFWRAWLCYAALLAGYAFVLAAALRTSTSQPLTPTAAAAASFVGGLLKNNLLPGAIGGPWQWWLLPDHAYALGAPPAALTWLAIAVAIGTIGASVVRRRASWRAWGAFAAWLLLADMAPIIIGRLNWYPALLSLDTRYVADAMAVLAVCIGLAFLPLREQERETGEPAGPGGQPGTAPAQPSGGAPRPPRPMEHRWRYAASGVLAVLLVGSVWSATSYQSATTGQPAASYIANASLAVEQAPRGTPVLNSVIPSQLKDAANDARAVVGAIQPGKLRWIGQPAGTVDGLKVFGPDGKLYPAWVYGASTGRPTPPHQCWPQRHHQIVLRFFSASPALTTLVRIGYLWGATRPQMVVVTYGNTSQDLLVRHGLHTAYLPVTGSASSVTISGLAPSAKLCIGDAEAGTAQPAGSGQVPQ